MKTKEQSLEAVQNFKKAIISCPDHKIKNITTDETKRDENFCVFIMTYGRSKKVKTYRTLMEYENASLNQDLYFICSDDDKDLQGYKDKYGERVLVFNKKAMVPYLDKGDTFNRYGVILYARNICFSFADKLGYRYFLELDDDYDKFSQRIFYDNSILMQKLILDYDRLFKIHLDFLKNTPCKTITMSQHGDYIGGATNNNALRGWQRKTMNSFFCDIQDPFIFDGSVNEDVNYYVQAGRQGIVNFNLFGFALNQESTQASSGGMTEGYLDGGTYLKSFYSVMYIPSAVKIGTIGRRETKRLHHKVKGNYAYPKILDEKYSKHTYLELNSKHEDSFLDEF